MSEELYLILPYFNFIGYRSGYNNLYSFLTTSKKYTNTRIILVEATTNTAQLPNLSNQVLKHVKVRADNILWIKENLINIGFKHLPDDWKYAGWIDRDIEFKNLNWANICINKLKQYELIQPWKECIFLDEHKQAKVEKYFNKSSAVNKRILSQCYVLSPDKTEDNYFEHAGHVWCCTKKFYNKIGLLCDKAIMGGGDGLLVAGINQRRTHPHYRYLGSVLKEYCDKLRGTKLGYIDETIYHHYHGSIENRKYVSRYDELYKLNYNPTKHLSYNEDDVLKFTEEGRILEEPIRQYLLSRSED
jgi:hypothetical protein